MRLAPEEQEAVRTALSILPPSHAARVALERGADPAVLIQLVDEDALTEALQEIWFAAYRRCLARARR
jgi:hypothetical protein